MKFRKASSLLLAFSLLSSMAQPARADDGSICKGLGFLICAPIGLAMLLAPKSPYEHMVYAVRAGDLDKVKRLQQRADTATPSEVLETAALEYLSGGSPAQQAGRLSIIQYLLDDHLADVSGTQGTKLLQMTVSHYTYNSQSAELSWPKRLTLAKAVIAHGATAEKVALNECKNCDVDNEFLPLMIKNGADPNRRNNMDPALLNILINQDKFDAAERLIQLGADPNGGSWYGESILALIAKSCDLQRLRKSYPAERVDAEWQQCVAGATARTRFAIAHGADPNGKTDSTKCCLTPYDIARQKQNEVLAQALLELGADPDFGARCRQAAQTPASGRSSQ